MVKSTQIFVVLALFLSISSASAQAPTVTWRLINAATQAVIVPSIPDTYTLDYVTLGAQQINFEIVVSPNTVVKKVAFYQNNRNTNTDSVVPFAFFGDKKGVFTGAAPVAGVYAYEARLLNNAGAVVVASRKSITIVNRNVNLCAGVTCRALDLCHVVGTCFAGVCSNPLQRDGRVCDDGNANTVNDICVGGVCAGTLVNLCAGVQCAPLDQCHLPGVCDALTGRCTNPPKPDYYLCDDGIVSTVTDVCLAGVCKGFAVIPCSGDGLSGPCPDPVAWDCVCQGSGACTCEPPAPPCKTEFDCSFGILGATGYECFLSKCLLTGKEVFPCVGTSCADAALTCQTDAALKARCFPPPLFTCTTSAECPALNKNCLKGLCYETATTVCVPGNGDCPAGGSCGCRKGGLDCSCTPALPICATDADCGIPQIGEPGFECFQGQCRASVDLTLCLAGNTCAEPIETCLTDADLNKIRCVAPLIN